MRLGDQPGVLGTASLTAVALVAFAANSLLCRLALGEAQVDAASYTSRRLASGAATLWVIVAVGGVLFLSEAITYRLVLSGSVILGGVALAIWGRDYALRLKPETSGG